MSMGTAEQRYRQLEQTRQSYLDRARDCAELTIPSLIPPDVHNETSDLYTPFQGIGARGVNNLASKLSLALLLKMRLLVPRLNNSWVSMNGQLCQRLKRLEIEWRCMKH